MVVEDVLNLMVALKQITRNNTKLELKTDSAFPFKRKTNMKSQSVMSHTSIGMANVLTLYMLPGTYKHLHIIIMYAPVIYG